MKIELTKIELTRAQSLAIRLSLACFGVMLVPVSLMPNVLSAVGWGLLIGISINLVMGKLTKTIN